LRPSKPEQERVMNFIKHSAAPGLYKIVGTLPVESDSHLTYRITRAIETFEAHCGRESADARRLNDHAN